MFVYTPRDLIGLVILAVFLCIAILVWLLAALAWLRGWTRRTWNSIASRWSRRNG